MTAPPIHGGGLRVVADLSQDRRGIDQPTYSIFALDRMLQKASRIAGKIVDGYLQLPIERGMLMDADPVPRREEPPPGATLYGRVMDRDGRVMDRVPEQPELDALTGLGSRMETLQLTGDPASEISAGYTYLGQFIAHDVTETRPVGDRMCNWRSSALDLDGLFFDREAFPAYDKGHHLKANVAVGGIDEDVATFDDLPRTPQGAPLVPDPRNDHNVAVAQTHVAMAKFHQTVATLCGEDGARRTTTRHYQSVVLHDYLKRVCDPEVYDDVLRNGRAVVLPGGVPDLYELPVEFAAACFRFGHSMARPTYPNWNAVDPQQPGDAHGPTRFALLLASTAQGGGLGPNKRLLRNWITRWPNLVPMGGSNPNLAAEIDTHFPSPLFALRPWMVADPPDEALTVTQRHNLATRTLVRGRSVELPTGEQLAEHVLHHLPGDRPRFAVLDWQQLLDATHARLREYLETHAAVFRGRTPLWLYTLCEAKACHCGQRLGPLGSRIVMESLHAAIEASPDGIVRPDQTVDFVPDPRLGSADGRVYTYPDLLGCVATHWVPR